MSKDERIPSVGEIVAEVLKALGHAKPDTKEPTLDERFAKQIKDARQGDRPALPIEIVKDVVSPFTGAKFNATIQHGKVLVLDDYRYPDGYDRHQNDNGGLVPNGLPILDTTGQRTPPYKQWLYESFAQADNRALVGKPLPKHLKSA